MSLYTPEGLAKGREFKDSFPFAGCSENANIIAQRMIKSPILCKLLSYGDSGCLARQIVPDSEKIKLLNKNIRIIPYIPKETDMINYVVIQFDNFVKSPRTNLVTNYIVVDVICHIDSWLLDGGKIRPYMIMDQVHNVLADSKLTGMGPVEFISAQQLLVSPTMAGFTMIYEVGDIV